MVHVAPVGEYPCYSNFVVNTGLGERQFSFKERMRMQLVARIQEWWENRIKVILAQSGLYHFKMIDVATTINGVKHILNENFRGETILTLGVGLREILDESCGIISIGPFGCMHARTADAMLKKEMNAKGKARIPGWNKKALRFKDIGNFPFLSIETDGSPFPQLVEANLEAFVLQADRLHKRMKQIKQQRIQKRQWRILPVTLYELVLGNGKVQRAGKNRHIVKRKKSTAR
jgi:predicted nucleotide-binding protein (sugar kinase/HSP70/actin superfamily)